MVWRMQRILWIAKISDECVLRETDTTSSLMRKIRNRQATFFGHVIRREKLEHLVITGMIERKRYWGKQREKMLGGLQKVT